MTSIGPNRPMPTIPSLGGTSEKIKPENGATRKAGVPPTVKSAKEQISKAVSDVKNSGTNPKGEHATRRGGAQESKFYHHIVAKLLNSISLSKSENEIGKLSKEHEAALEQFKGELKDLAQAMKKGDEKGIQETASNFITAVYQQCDKRSVPNHRKALVSEAAISSLLKTYAENFVKNPRAANHLLNALSSSLDSTTKDLVKALLIHQGFHEVKDDNLTPESAGNILKAAMYGLAANFLVTSEMVPSMTRLAGLSQSNNSATIEQYIDTAIAVKSYDLADHLIKLQGGKIPHLDKQITGAIEDQDIHLVKLLAKHEPGSVQGIIKQCVDYNSENFLVEVLNETNTPLTFEQKSQFSKQAFGQGNLSLMKAVNPNSWKEEAAKYLQAIPKEHKGDKLILLFLNSNIKELKELETVLDQKDLKQIADFQANGGKLIARFPSPKFQQEMFETYKKRNEELKKTSAPNYQQQQLAYGNGRYEKFIQVLEDLKRDKAQSLETVFKKLGTYQPSPKHPSYWRESGGEQTAIGGRYSMFKILAHEKIKQGRQGKTPNVTLKAGNDVQITYTSKNGEVKLTRLAPLSRGSGTNIAFYHTEAVEGQPLLSQLGISEDWKDLLGMNVDASNPDSVKSFQDKIAIFYWKGCQLMPTERGSSQAMLELHNMLYQIHGLNPPAPSRQVVLPDCVALCSTLEEFKDRYAACWDFG